MHLMRPTIDTDPPEVLKYWINERTKVQVRKALDMPKPWSEDPIMQVTYFTNVHRQDDPTTRVIQEWAQRPDDTNAKVLFRLMFARLVNFSPVFQELSPEASIDGWIKVLRYRKATKKKVFGSAYIVSTCGKKIEKISYIEKLLQEWWRQLEHDGEHLIPIADCWRMQQYLLEFRGLSNFMTGQIVADFKHCRKTVLSEANDFYTFVTPGPGSKRGLAWYYGYGEFAKVTDRMFPTMIEGVHADLKLPSNFEMQDLQNCLCEYDKYMRILHGVGRSKRTYPGNVAK